MKKKSEIGELISSNMIEEITKTHSSRDKLLPAEESIEFKLLD